MKKTLCTSEAARMLAENKDNGFSYEGAYALIEYLENMESETGEEMEFDAVAIRCDFSEFESAIEAADNYIDKSEEFDGDEEDKEKAALEFLQGNTTVIEFDGGLIIQDY
jgi:hypothetical protein